MSRDPSHLQAAIESLPADDPRRRELLDLLAESETDEIDAVIASERARGCGGGRHVLRHQRLDELDGDAA